jgi:hypothetical protein
VGGRSDWELGLSGPLLLLLLGGSGPSRAALLTAIGERDVIDTALATQPVIVAAVGGNGLTGGSASLRALVTLVLSFGEDGGAVAGRRACGFHPISGGG